MLTLAVAATTLLASQASNLPSVQIDWTGQPVPISALIYGANDSQYHHIKWSMFRLGGNAATTYNWENNFDNAGSDWKQSSGYGWTMRHTPVANRSVPAAAIINHHETALQMGARSIVQVNLMGYVAADGDGSVLESEKAPSKRWVAVKPKKPGPFATKPDLTDGVVYIDEMVHHLVQKYGPASSSRGIYGYSLDNEPGLWHHTHPYAHPEKTGAKELVEKSIAAAIAIKAVDPTAKIHGFAPFGVHEYMALTGASDWPEIQKQNGYDWYIDYYLDEFAKASKREGKRLLDTLDLHFYVGGGVIEEGGIDAQLQSQRAMWDRSYTEQSWLGEVHPTFFPLIPRIKKSITKYFPKTELAFSEWNTERPTTLTGGVSTADMLGVFGQEGVHSAMWWSLLGENLTPAQLAPSKSAFELFRNFDGKGGSFGDLGYSVKNPDAKALSIYASKNSVTGNLHLILIGKRRHVPIKFQVALPESGLKVISSVGFGQTFTNSLGPVKCAKVDGKWLEVELPKQCAVHLVLSK